ncbi:MAG: subclass B3 metallo-beta-lactamase [Alphaproteobacteria bacterium]|nr:subclass B3 metallo-beta-lactamase [Alphaproteobacteria bacterium]
MKPISLFLGALAAMAAGALSFAADAPAQAPVDIAAQREAMNQPQEPFQIADNLYYVGMNDIAAYLITTKKDGYILIDGGMESSAPMILKNIRSAGFNPKMLRIIVNTSARMEHAGGIAALKKATGALLFASDADAPVLEAGGHGDYALGDSATFPPAKVDGTIKDGEYVSVGDTGVVAHMTPGHTKGCTTWSLDTTVDGERKQVVFTCDITVTPGFKLLDNAAYPTQADDFVKTFNTLFSLPCDIFLASNGSVFDLKGKYAKLQADPKSHPFNDPEGYRNYVALAREQFKQALLSECKNDPTCAQREGLQ